MGNLVELGARTALVTGAGRGVGREVALLLAANGSGTVIVNDYYADRAEAVAEEIERAGGKALAVACDVGDYESVAAMVETATAAAGPIQVLVNNAGSFGHDAVGVTATPFHQSEPGEWERYFRANLYGTMHCTRCVLPGMLEAGYGRIVTVVSDAGRVGEGELVAYSAAKAGAAGMTRAVAKLAGPAGVTANNVSLGAIVTPTSEALVSRPEVVDKMLSRYSVKRLGLPADGAALIVFLCSEAAGWITGQTYPVNGGYSVAL